MRNFFFSFWAKKLKVRRQPNGLHENVSKMTGHFNGRNGTEILLFDVIVVLSIAVFLRQWVVRGEGFESKHKPYFTSVRSGRWVCQLSDGIIRFFFVIRLFNCGLAMFHSEVSNRR